MRLLRLLLGLTLLLAALPAVAPAVAQVAFERGEVAVVTAGGPTHRFTVEVAKNFEQLAQGLMYRRSMPEGHGMLFDFGAPRTVSMWMKNTYIPLDMLFVAKDGRIVMVAERTVPHSETPIGPPGEVRAVLELNAGTASRLGIRAGDRLEHPIFSAR